MKCSINLPVSLKQCLTFVALFFFHSLALAQDKAPLIDVDVHKDPPAPAWHASPWAWIIAAAAFILILVAILSNNRNKGN